MSSRGATTAVPLTAFVITKNEEAAIADCLASLDFVTEIVVVDDFSDDNTAGICERFGCRVIRNRFSGFRDQKRFAMLQGGNDWVLELDADERVSPGMKAAIMALTNADFESHAAFSFKRLTRFWGKWLRHSSLYPDYKVRLYHRARGEWSPGTVHERFVPTGPVRRIPEDIIHCQDLTLKVYAARTVRYAELSAQDYRDRGKRSAWYDMFRPLHTLVYRYVIRLGFLDGIQGVVVAVMGAFGTFMKYFRLYELEREARQQEWTQQ